MSKEWGFHPLECKGVLTKREIGGLYIHREKNIWGHREKTAICKAETDFQGKKNLLVP